MTDVSRLPPKLKETGLFCCWQYEERNGRRTKVPYNPRTGGRAQSTNPGTFAPLRVAGSEQGRYDGLGVGIFGSLGAIDIDHCITEDGLIADLALDIMEVMDAYTERSPSGLGLRILFTIPEGFEYDKGRYYINNQKAGLEVYIAGCTNKYVTVTGDTLTPGRDLEERSGQLLTVLDKYMRRPERERPTPAGKPLDFDAEIGNDAPPVRDLEDAELIGKAKGAKNGALFSALMAGDTTGYKSASEADIALCNMLAFWTGRDAARMDRIYRTSGLMREKWDRPTAGSTYGAITIQNAIASTRQIYDPKAHFKAEAAKVFAPMTAEPVQLEDLCPEKNDRYRWTDIGNGNLFADWYKAVARYVPERKKWFVYKGGVWRPDTGDKSVMELCKRLADALSVYALALPDGPTRDEYRAFVERWQVRRNRETILKDASSVHPLEMLDFDKDPLLFNCQNGTLDLRTREFRPHDPADLLTIMAGVKYDPDAQAPLWERVIEDVTQGDAQKALFLQKALGYGLTGDTSEECFFILYGATTRNGKGTVMETYMRVMGGYGRAALPETIAQKDRSDSRGPSEDIAGLAGARVVNISEPDKNMVLSAALVKTLTGRDTIRARFLHENSFEFEPQFKLYINTNHLPRVTDPTIFDSGRVKVIPFERHFSEEEQDRSLKGRLRKADSLSGILNWCLDGLWAMRETGLGQPPAVKDATAQYQMDSDKVARFIEETMEPDPQGEIRTEDAYQQYQAWCNRCGLMAESITNWRARILVHAEIRRKRPTGAGRSAHPASFITGYRWREKTEQIAF